MRLLASLRIVRAVTGTSVIVSSYNQPNALALVFAGLLTQTHPIDEVLIGDDGSQDDTRDLVQAFAKRAPFRVVYETQEDRGFRKSRALNNALRRAQHEHVLFLDGDCVPSPAWAANYARVLAAGVPFATAGYVLMDLRRTQQLTQAQIADGRIDLRTHWLSGYSVLVCALWERMHLRDGRTSAPTFGLSEYLGLGTLRRAG